MAERFQGGGFVFGALGAPVLFSIAAVLAVAAGLLAFASFPRRGERVAREEDEAVPLPFPATPA